ncbi:MAG TPA: DUF4276 family protein [Terriglobia bacterium]|nr:DUF4276 family protein [Terriglobia bacterium]
MSVHVYVEGGGNYRHTDTSTACRRGFRQLFEKIGLPARRLSVVACGSRSQTFKDFRKAVRQQTGDFVILLVDSEGPVGAPGTWVHLNATDGWQPPMAGVTEDQAHLMVQCMEAWFLADREALHEFYGPEFLAGSLPGQADIEQIPNRFLVTQLIHASRRTSKGPYHKTRHGFALLEKINPQKVREASAHAGKLFDVLIREANV